MSTVPITYCNHRQIEVNAAAKLFGSLGRLHEKEALSGFYFSQRRVAGLVKMIYPRLPKDTTAASALIEEERLSAKTAGT